MNVSKSAIKPRDSLLARANPALALPLLHGYVILDMTRYLAGPFSTMILAALGATVVKVEEPGLGDTSRHQPPFVTKAGLRGERLAAADRGLAYLKRNASKLSIAVDLKSPEGKAALLKLISRSDALVHNFRPGVVERLGLDFASVEATNPGLVYCGISGFGPYAPDGDERGALDIIAQALCGVMAITGLADGEPLRSGAPISDCTAGMFAAIAVLAGLLRRDGRQGVAKGVKLDVSMLNSVSFMTWDEHLDYYLRLGLPDRTGNSIKRIVPFNTYATRTGPVAIAASGVNEWRRLCEATGIEEFNVRQDWLEVPNRVRDRETIDRLLQEWAAQFDRDEVVATLLRHGATAAPVYSVGDLVADQRFVDTMLYPVQDPELGVQPALAGRFPVVADGRWSQFHESPAPTLGRDTAQVLETLGGYSPDEILHLISIGAVGDSEPNQQGS